MLSRKGRTETYQKHIGVLIETNNLYTLPYNRGRVLPRLSDSVANHLLRLGAVELRLGRLTRKDNADFCWKIHRIFAVAAIDQRKLGMLQDSTVRYVTVSHIQGPIGKEELRTYSEKVEHADIHPRARIC